MKKKKKKKKKSTEDSTNITENFQWLAWRQKCVRIPRRVVQRHSEACGQQQQQQQLEVDGVSRDNWIPAPQRQTQQKHGCGVTQALSLFCNSLCWSPVRGNRVTVISIQKLNLNWTSH
jgi:hypothetical protein